MWPPSSPGCAKRTTSSPISQPAPKVRFPPCSTPNSATIAGSALPHNGRNEKIRAVNCEITRMRNGPGSCTVCGLYGNQGNHSPKRIGISRIGGGRARRIILRRSLSGSRDSGGGTRASHASRLPMRSASGRVRRGLDSARLARGEALRDRHDLSACCGVRRQLPAPPEQLLFACQRWPWHLRWRAFFRRRTVRAGAHRLRPVPRESRTSGRRFRLLRDCPCLRIVAHRGANENNQLARSWAPSFFSRAEIILEEKSLVCPSVSVASRL